MTKTNHIERLRYLNTTKHGLKQIEYFPMSLYDWREWMRERVKVIEQRVAKQYPKNRKVTPEEIEEFQYSPDAVEYRAWLRLIWELSEDSVQSTPTYVCDFCMSPTNTLYRVSYEKEYTHHRTKTKVVKGYQTVRLWMCENCMKSLEQEYKVSVLETMRVEDYPTLT